MKTYYNRKYIESFDNIEYLSFLKDENRMSIFLNDYLNRYVNNNGKVILFKESLDHFILYLLSCNSKFINDKLILNYVNFIKEIIRNDSSEIITNKIFNSRVISEIIFSNYFSNDEFKKIYNYELDRVSRIKNYIFKDRDISFDDFNYISNYYFQTKNLDIDGYSEFIKYVMNKLINNKYYKVSPQILYAFSNYLCYFYDNSFDCRFIYSDLDNSYGKFYINKKYIILNSNYLNTNFNSSFSILEEFGFNRREFDYVSLLTTAFHELTHAEQYGCIKLRKGFNERYLANEIENIIINNKDDYKLNYHSDETEFDADENSYFMLGEFINEFYNFKDKKYLIDKCNDKIETIKDLRVISYKFDDDRSIYINEYDLVKLVKSIKNNPNLLNSCSMLNLFFNKDGSFNEKSITINGLSNGNSGLKMILGFFISNGVNNIKKDIDNNEITYDEIISMFNNMIDYINYYNSNIDRIYKISIDSTKYNKYHLKLDEIFYNILKSEFIRISLDHYNQFIELYYYVKNMYPDLDFDLKIKEYKDNIVYNYNKGIAYEKH